MLPTAPPTQPRHPEGRALADQGSARAQAVDARQDLPRLRPVSRSVQAVLTGRVAADLQSVGFSLREFPAVSPLRRDFRLHPAARLYSRPHLGARQPQLSEASGLPGRAACCRRRIGARLQPRGSLQASSEARRRAADRASSLQPGTVEPRRVADALLLPGGLSPLTGRVRRGQAGQRPLLPHRHFDRRGLGRVGGARGRRRGWHRRVRRGRARRLLLRRASAPHLGNFGVPEAASRAAAHVIPVSELVL